MSEDAKEASGYLIVVADRSPHGSQAMESFGREIQGLKDVLATWPAGADYALLTVVRPLSGDAAPSADVVFSDGASLGEAVQSIRDDHLRGLTKGVVRTAVARERAGAVEAVVRDLREGSDMLPLQGRVSPGRIGVVVSVAGYPTTMAGLTPEAIRESEARLARRLGIDPVDLSLPSHHANVLKIFEAMAVEGLPEHERGFALSVLGISMAFNHPRHGTAFRQAVSEHLARDATPYVSIALDRHNAISYAVAPEPGNLLDMHGTLRAAGTLKPGFGVIEIVEPSAGPETRTLH